MTDKLEASIENLMNINQQPGPPSFIADKVERGQWIADIVDGAGVENESSQVQQMHIVSIPQRSRLRGFTPMAIGFGIAAGLAVVIGALFWPTEPSESEALLVGQGAKAEIVSKENKSKSKKEEPLIESTQDLGLAVVITDEGFDLEMHSHIRTPWPSGLTPAVPEFAPPDIPKKDNDWDFAELKQRLGVLKGVYDQEDTIVLDLEYNYPCEVLMKTMDSARDPSGEPLFPNIGLKYERVSGASRLVTLVIVHYPGHGQEPSESQEQDLNLTVAISDKGFHFKTNPLYRMPWMNQGLADTGPDIPKKDKDWDFDTLTKRLREFKDYHSKETSIVFGAEDEIPFGVLVEAIAKSVDTTEEPLFPHVILTRLTE